MDIENDYFDKDGLVDNIVDKIIIEYDSDEMEDEDEDDLLDDDDDRHFIDMALQLSQQSEVNTTELTTTTNSQHHLTDMDPDFENMDPNFLECIQPLHALHTK